MTGIGGDADWYLQAVLFARPFPVREGTQLQNRGKVPIKQIQANPIRKKLPTVANHICSID